MDRALVDRILRLKPVERLRLMDFIYGSLERPDSEIDEIWYDEAERRLAAHEAGEVQGIPADQVLGKRRCGQPSPCSSNTRKSAKRFDPVSGRSCCGDSHTS